MFWLEGLVTLRNRRKKKSLSLLVLAVLLISLITSIFVYASSVTILASGESDPQGIVVSGGYVYWAEYRGHHIKRVPTDGGTVTTLTDASWPFTNIVVDGGYVYWGGNGPDIRGREYIARVPISGGVMEILAGARYPWSIAVYQGRVYWCDFVSGDTCDIKSVSTSGGEVRTLVTGQGYPNYIMAAEGYVYWAELTLGNIKKIPVAGGSVETIISGPGCCGTIYHPYLSEGYIYWAVNQRAPSGAIKRVSGDGGVVQTLATGEDNPFAVFVNGGYVYWTTGAWYSTPPGTIKRVPINGGTIEILLSNLTFPQQLAISGDYVYWTEGGEHTPGYVKKASLPARILTVTVDIDPDTLNLGSKGRWITAYISLPEGYSVGYIDLSTVSIDNIIPAQWGDIKDGVLMVKFSRNDVINYINDWGIREGEVTLTVSGMVSNRPFEGDDTITVVE